MTGYEGTYEGQHYSSLYPNVYRVQYVAYIGGRRYDVDKNVTAMDEYHARQRAMNGSSDIRGDITVEHVASLKGGSDE